MGMFDNLICKRPLPGIQPSWYKSGYDFQTKDLECILAHYEIGDDSKLYETHPGGWDVPPKVPYHEPFNYTGEIEFYGSNCVGSGPLGYITRNGEDVEFVTYVARFLDGVCSGITQTEYRKEPALSSGVANAAYKKHRDYVDSVTPDPPEVKVGMKLFKQHAYGADEGMWVEVVAEGESNTRKYGKEKEFRWKQWSVKLPDGTLEIANEHELNSSLFESAEVAKRVREAEARPYEIAKKD